MIDTFLDISLGRVEILHDLHKFYYGGAIEASMASNWLILWKFLEMIIISIL